MSTSRRLAGRKAMMQNGLLATSGARVTVRCWKCGAKRRRRCWTMRPVVTTGRMLATYGACPARPHGWMCGGTMHRDVERRIVLRAAIDHDNAGGNARSEYDG